MRWEVEVEVEMEVEVEVEAGKGGKPCVIELSHAMGYDVESRDKRLLQTGIQFVRPGRR